MKIKALRDLSEYSINLQELVKYHNGDDAGIDLVACEPVYLPGSGLKSQLVPSGIAVELPSAHFALILPRSGLAKRDCLHVLGGVIDNGFRGELIINLMNFGRSAVSYPTGSRVAQLVVLPYYKAKLEWLAKHEHFTQTERGEKGHGSTGI